MEALLLVLLSVLASAAASNTTQAPSPSSLAGLLADVAALGNFDVEVVVGEAVPAEDLGRFAAEVATQEIAVTLRDIEGLQVFKVPCLGLNSVAE